MIRVNLAKSQSYSSIGTQTAISMDQSAPGPHPGVKVAVILVLPILLYVYESYELSQKEAVLNQVNLQAQQIEQEVSDFGSVKAVVDGLVKEKEKLNEQLVVIQKISQKRAFKLDAIQTVQRSLLDDLWLEELVVDQENLLFKGLSRSPTSVQEIVDNLLKNPSIQSSLNRDLTRKKIGKEMLNSFEIVARIKK